MFYFYDLVFKPSYVRISLILCIQSYSANQSDNRSEIDNQHETIYGVSLILTTYFIIHAPFQQSKSHIVTMIWHKIMAFSFAQGFYDFLDQCFII